MKNCLQMDLFGKNFILCEKALAFLLEDTFLPILTVKRKTISQKASLEVIFQLAESIPFAIFLSALEKKLADKKEQMFKEFDVSVSFTENKQDSYENDFVLTVFSQKKEILAFYNLVLFLQEQNLQVEKIDIFSADNYFSPKKLNISAKLESTQSKEYETNTANYTSENIQNLFLQEDISCQQYFLSGELADLDYFLMLLKMHEKSWQLELDIMPTSLYKTPKSLFCFDMDSTLIKAEVIDELAKAYNKGDEVSKITARAMAGELDFNKSFTHRLSLLAGLEESVLVDIAENLELMDGAEILFKNLHALGHKTAILSGGFDYFAEYIQKKLNIDYVFSNKLAIENGKLTGKVAGEIINAEAKARILQELAKKEGLSLEQVVAVGDGANDLPMLSLAGIGIAFHAKEKVKKAAKHSFNIVGLDAILYLLGERVIDKE